MYGKPTMTFFKYQVYLYGSKTITYLNAILGVVTELALWVIKLLSPPTRSTPSQCMAAFLHLDGKELQYGWGTITCKTTIPIPRVWNRVKFHQRKIIFGLNKVTLLLRPTDETRQKTGLLLLSFGKMDYFWLAVSLPQQAQYVSPPKRAKPRFKSVRE